MKRIILSASLFIALSGALAVAQTATQPDSSPGPTNKGYHHGGHGGGHNPQKEAAMLSKRLNLTSDQQASSSPSSPTATRR